MAIAECLAQLKWLESIDPSSLPDDHLPEDWALRSRSVVADFRELNLTSAKTTEVKANLYRVCKDGRDPLSDIGCEYADSRFNFRGFDGVFFTRTLYFGYQDLTTFVERFHKEEVLDDPEFAPEPQTLYQFEVDFSNILVVDSESATSAIGVPFSVILNEWSYLNEDYELPAPSQVLGYIAKCMGYEGMLYRSARFSLGRNLVIFSENAKSKIEACKKISDVPLDINAFRKRIAGQ